MASSAVLLNERLDRHTSMGVGGPADAVVFPGSVEELSGMVAFLQENGIPYIAVGNWTNLIVTDAGYRGVVICLKNLRNHRLEPGGGAAMSLYAEAGVSLSELVGISVREALTGLEFAAGIPGSVGGAVRMNAGAYGSEMKDVLSSLVLLESSGAVRREGRDGLVFSYRSLDLPAGSIIVAAFLELMRGDRERIQARIAEIAALRRSKHPLQYPNAGSIFKNPKEAPAGRIIEELGLRGLRIGGAGVSEMHGNFIVNLGRATAADVLALIAVIQKKVFEDRGVRLETEVRIIGEMS
ncbi:MAG: UDP-N-acetylmuramate dehydrogenase [Deltaproteobacteria bacterium]|nr:UDP-N-acetylmuramate dehydrogenase [Deltaproteobacteria bacterium]